MKERRDVFLPVSLDCYTCPHCDYGPFAQIAAPPPGREGFGTRMDYCSHCGKNLHEGPPVADRPNSTTGLLPWNDDSPWPFPTQGKPAPLERVRWITLHHSAGERATTNVTYWNNSHTLYKRWPHIGYHFAIAALMEGDPIDLWQCNKIGEITWHDSRNHDTVGVCIAGDLRAGRDGEPTPEQVALTGRLLAWLVPQLPNFQGVIVHKTIQATLCPGDVERWGDDIVAATLEYGLDLSDKFNVPLPRFRMGGFSFGLRTQGPPADSYEGV